MTQHDMSIANQSFPATRGDLNDALQALASTSKGNARPSTVYAGQFWLDDNTPSATTWTLNFYDGTDDIPVGYVNTTTNVYTPAGFGGARVGTQFDKTSSTTLGDVTDLSVTVEAGRKYKFSAALDITTGGGGGKVAIGGTATATSVAYTGKYIDNSGGTVIIYGRATSLGTAVAGSALGTSVIMEVEGSIVVNAAGTLTLQFAQNTSNGAPSSVLVGSTFTIQPIS